MLCLMKQARSLSHIHHVLCTSCLIIYHIISHIHHISYHISHHTIYHIISYITSYQISQHIIYHITSYIHKISYTSHPIYIIFHKREYPMCLRRQFIISHICDTNVKYMIRMSQHQISYHRLHDTHSTLLHTFLLFLMHVACSILSLSLAPYPYVAYCLSLSHPTRM